MVWTSDDLGGSYVGQFTPRRAECVETVRSRAEELARTGVYPNWTFILLRLGYEFHDPHPAIDDAAVKASLDTTCAQSRGAGC